jgi:hypothetical protein
LRQLDIHGRILPCMRDFLRKVHKNLVGHTSKVTYAIVFPATLMLRTAGGADIVETQVVFDLQNPQPMQIEVGDTRAQKIKTLEKFFDRYNSPLGDHADTFVDVADMYDMDFKLLPAISCMESSCGKQLIPGSYNPFGWGIYGNNAIWFEDYDEAISVVGKGLNDNYLSRGLDTVEEIAPVYTPPRYVHWRNGVNFFVNQMDEVEMRELAKDTILASSLTD